MNRNFMRISGTIACLGIGASLAFGIQAAAANSDTAPPTASTDFPENANGDTFGSGMNLPTDDFPDLVAAIGTNGVNGYVYSSDLIGPEMSRAEIAALPQDTSTTVALPDRVINLYAVDGVTVLGSYAVG